MSLKLRRIGLNEECEIKEAKIQMIEEPVDSEMDELDKAPESELEYRERIVAMDRLLTYDIHSVCVHKIN
jgi:hypothetical protein